MRKQTYWGLGLLILLIIINVSCMIAKPPVKTPSEPETITYEGETLSLRKLLGDAYDMNWEERVPILKHIIAEVPDSKYAYYARHHLAICTENGYFIDYNPTLLFERLEPLLNYHPDCPGLFYDLLRYGWDFDPESTISYGKKALKYVDKHNKYTHYGAYPESIHKYLGNAYQNIGDYSTALEHFNQALTLSKADHWVSASNIRLLKVKILECIREGNAVKGSVSDGTVSPLSVSAPETREGETLSLHERLTAAYEKSWEERVPILKQIIAEAPNSEYAYYARYDLAIHDENGKYIADYPLLFKRLKPLLKFHPDSPNLLYSLLIYGRDTDPKAAIRYGKEAFKHVDRYKRNSRYNADPVLIHKYLGYAYHYSHNFRYSTALEYYKQALEHYNQAVNILKATPEMRGSAIAIRLLKVDILACTREIRDGSIAVTYAPEIIFSRPLPVRAPRAGEVVFSSPDVPTSLTATAGSAAGSVDLTWRAPENDGGKPITGYRVKYVKTENDKVGYWTDWVPTGSPNTSWTITGLKSGALYRFRVVAINSVGYSEGSKVARIYAPFACK